MKRFVFALVAIFFLSTMLSCDNVYQRADYSFGSYQVYRQDHGMCEMYVTILIDENEDYYYYLADSGCSVENYYYIRYEQKYMPIPTAIEEGIISIADVIESEIPALVIEEKTE